MTLQVVKVSAPELRRLFNESSLWDRCQTGELVERRSWQGEPHPTSGQKAGTQSISSFLVDRRGRKLAFVHYFLLRDGSIANGKGLPDPKWCIVGGVRYQLDPSLDDPTSGRRPRRRGTRRRR